MAYFQKLISGRKYQGKCVVVDTINITVNVITMNKLQDILYNKTNKKTSIW